VKKFKLSILTKIVNETNLADVVAELRCVVCGVCVCACVRACVCVDVCLSVCLYPCHVLCDIGLR